MNIVIQCAASKHRGGSLKTKGGQTVRFVANPELASKLAPLPPDCVYRRPDDPCLDAPGYTWLQRLEEYVLNEPKNPLGLLEAYKLYNPTLHPKVYEQLVERFTKQKVFILSAGWGMIRANYPTPAYNITFSSQAGKNSSPPKKNEKPWVYRPPRSECQYFQQVPVQGNDPIVFVGSLDYLLVFRRLVECLHRRTIVFTYGENCATKARKKLPREWEVRPFQSEHSRTWHYECAEALAHGALSLD
jgi:hypothetical protein